ncbi:alpha/beta-hydrolase [Dendrothele bispora CBS 962.96]|uniref:Carboxylic ester hydrolase n=1 Tax=Dendrothele bispora (strain CBS 962.96) TaxID=1314807 RepID=A0A4S8MS49_DENBC|nr:alpha/beta-hydrolase [Dendrothele bispora CBS 962.96]
MALLSILTLFSVLASLFLGSNAQQPSVSLDYGTFIGSDDSSTGITSYLGIRFADPPTGELRWKAAVSPPSSNVGTVDATGFANICIGIGQTGNQASEDCLFGNVFVPSGTTSDDGLPVMVWFHGGGFQSGSTRDFDPTMLIKSSAHPMLFASFAYRLGALGFMGGSRIKEDGQLNIGLQDQRVALAWVQRYISSFGGDPNRVTISGQSGGAGCAMFHLLANDGDTGGLFHAAMGESPSLSFTPTFDSNFVEGLFNQFSSNAGCGTNTSSNVMFCLRSADIGSLTQAWGKLVTNRTSTLFNFAPIVDGDLIRSEPVSAFRSGNFADVPVLFGSNTNEGSGWSAGLRNAAANTAEKNATEQTVSNFLRGQWPSLSQASFNEGLQLYPRNSFDSVNGQGAQMYGEARYICTAGLITASLSGAGQQAFQYHYNNPHLGSFHGSELGGLFPTQNSLSRANVQDLELFQAMREYWSAFVTTWTPTSSSANVDWDVVSNTTDGSPRILLQPGGIQMEDITDLLDRRCAFWHDSLGGQALSEMSPDDPSGPSGSTSDASRKSVAYGLLLKMCVVVLMILQ